jgi:hypothetical protein
MVKIRKFEKKAQIKIQQMTFMLIAVTLLFILVGVFFVSIRLYNLKKIASSLEEQNALLLVSKLANSPEFSCGNSFGESLGSCVDFDKLISLQGRAEEYSDFWGVAKIEVRKVYPSDRENVLCDSSNYPNCDIIRILDKNVNMQPASSNFVSLCRKDSNGIITYDKCELAILMVSSEEKRT